MRSCTNTCMMFLFGIKWWMLICSNAVVASVIINMRLLPIEGFLNITWYYFPPPLYSWCEWQINISAKEKKRCSHVLHNDLCPLQQVIGLPSQRHNSLYSIYYDACHLKNTSGVWTLILDVSVPSIAEPWRLSASLLWTEALYPSVVVFIKHWHGLWRWRSMTREIGISALKRRNQQD